MRFKNWGAAVVAAALFGVAGAAQASPFVLTLQEVGSNVVATGSGEFDLTGITYSFGAHLVVSAYMYPGFGRIVMGPVADYDVYIPPSGPTAFGSGSFETANSYSGDAVGVYGNSPWLLVPQGYVSGHALSDSATYLNATFASMGVTPGVYVWNWGTQADQTFTLSIGQAVTTPIPAALPLFSPGLFGLGLLGWRGKKKAQAAAA